MVVDVHNGEFIQECITMLNSESSHGDILIGIDGTIDNIRQIVVERKDREEHDDISTLSDYTTYINESVGIGSSVSFEWYCEKRKVGGHTGNVGRAYSALDMDATIIGLFGKSEKKIAKRQLGNHRVISIGEPTITDAVQFRDGKLMMGDVKTANQLTWDMICDTISFDVLLSIFDDTEIFSMGGWSTMPQISTIWNGLRHSLWPKLTNPPKSILIDPGDFRRLPVKRINNDLESLLSFNDVADIIISANKSEITHLEEALFGEVCGDFIEAVQKIQEHLEISKMIGHSQELSVLANGQKTYTGEPETIENPSITTASGDNFNAGYMYSQLMGCSDAASLVLANATANRFVRNGVTPTPETLLTYLNDIR